MAKPSVVLFAVAVAVLLASCHCLEPVTPAPLTPASLSEKCKKCIWAVAKAASASQWKAVENCVFWTPATCKLMQENMDAVQGVFLARMNPFTYATGHCIALDCEMKEHEVDVSSLQSIPISDLMVSAPTESAVADPLAAESDGFLAESKDKSVCSHCSSLTVKYLQENVVGSLLDDLCAAGEQEPATLVSYLKAKACDILKESPAATFAYFYIEAGLNNSIYGACSALGCFP